MTEHINGLGLYIIWLFILLKVRFGKWVDGQKKERTLG